MSSISFYQSSGDVPGSSQSLVDLAVFSFQVIAQKKQVQPDFACQKCDSTFQDGLELLKHELILHEDTWGFWCKICSIGFIDSRKTIEHAHTHEFNDILVCPVIGKASLPKAESSTDKPTGERNFCEIGTQTEANDNSDNLKSLKPDTAPESSGVAPISFQCTQCQELLYSKSDFMSHLSNMHKWSEPEEKMDETVSINMKDISICKKAETTLSRNVNSQKKPEVWPIGGDKPVEALDSSASEKNSWIIPLAKTDDPSSIKGEDWGFEFRGQTELKSDENDDTICMMNVPVQVKLEEISDNEEGNERNPVPDDKVIDVWGNEVPPQKKEEGQDENFGSGDDWNPGSESGSDSDVEWYSEKGCRNGVKKTPYKPPDPETLHCAHCPEEFSYKIDLIFHLAKHEDATIYPSYRYYKEKKKKIRKPRPYRFTFECDQCVFRFPSKEELDVHVKQLHTIPLWKIKEEEAAEVVPEKIPIKKVAAPPKRIPKKKAVAPRKRTPKKRKSSVKVIEPDDDEEFICEYCKKKLTLKLELLEHIASVHFDSWGKFVPAYRASKTEETRTIQGDLTNVSELSITEVRAKLSKIRHKRKRSPKRRPIVISSGPFIIAAESEKKIPKMKKNGENGCIYCPATFALKSQKYVHCITDHADIFKYQCPKCTTTFDSEKKLETHKIKRPFCIIRDSRGILKRQTKCTLCSLTIRSKDLDQHMRAHENNSCGLCGEQFSDKQGLEAHTEEYKGTCKPTCKLCNKTFRSLCYLETHNRKHTGDFAFSCEHCGQRFTRIQDLRFHQVTIHRIINENRPKNRGPYRLKQRSSTEEPWLRKRSYCPICSYEELDVSFQNHMEDNHVTRDESGLFLCKMCDYKTDKLGNMYYHMDKHARFYICSECGEGFGQPYKLKIHMDRHAGHKPWLCPGCPKRFLTKCSMKQHRDKHCSVMKERRRQAGGNVDPSSASDDVFVDPAPSSSNDAAVDPSSSPQGGTTAGDHDFEFWSNMV